MNTNRYKQTHTGYDIENKLYIISNRKVLNIIVNNNYITYILIVIHTNNNEYLIRML